MHRIVVVGGGAGGLELATRLGKLSRKKGFQYDVRVTLVDQNPTHVWKPLLHEVAAGSMDPYTHQLEYAAQAHWCGFTFEQGELVGVNRSGNNLYIAPVIDHTGEELLPARSLSYDTLVIAIGSTTHFYGVNGAAEHAIALDTVQQAERFRRRLISAARRARTKRGGADGTNPGINIAIVGAGATGVELSAELRSVASALATFGLYKFDPQRDIRITLVEAGPRVLPALLERVSSAASHELAKRSVDVLTGEKVIEVTATTLRMASGKVVPADLTVWAAGIKAPSVLSQLDGLMVNALGQLLVRPTLQVENDDDIFALGDCASCPIPQSESKVPPRAQAAHQQASFLVKAIKRRLAGEDLPVFRYRDLGSLVSLGHAGAVGSLMGGLASGSMLIGGVVAKIMYKSLYRMHVASLHGWSRMILNTVSHRLRRATAPHVKLH